MTGMLTVDGIDVLLKDWVVPLAPHFRQPNVDINLVLCESEEISALSGKKKDSVELTGKKIFLEIHAVPFSPQIYTPNRNMDKRKLAVL